jgi:sialic acid synthase SpsE
MRKVAFLFALILMFSCKEELIQQPENLISKDKMSAILYDLTVLTAAKNTSADVLKKQKIEAMKYIYIKHDVDSLQFVQSDVYYASNPVIYGEIYESVEAKVKGDIEIIEGAKKEQRRLDSIESVKTPKELDSIKAKKRNLPKVN